MKHPRPPSKPSSTVPSGHTMIGTITPPVGMIMYVVCALGKVSIGEFSREVWPFLIALTLALALITYIPILSMWLPNMLLPVK